MKDYHKTFSCQLKAAKEVNQTVTEYVCEVEVI